MLSLPPLVPKAHVSEPAWRTPPYSTRMDCAEKSIVLPGVSTKCSEPLLRMLMFSCTQGPGSLMYMQVLSGCGSFLPGRSSMQSFGRVTTQSAALVGGEGALEPLHEVVSQAKTTTIGASHEGSGAWRGQ